MVRTIQIFRLTHHLCMMPTSARVEPIPQRPLLHPTYTTRKTSLKALTLRAPRPLIKVLFHPRTNPLLPVHGSLRVQGMLPLNLMLWAKDSCKIFRNQTSERPWKISQTSFHHRLQRSSSKSQPPFLPFPQGAEERTSLGLHQ